MKSTASPPAPDAAAASAAAYAAFDHLATMVAVVSPDGRCVFANASFENVLGLSRRSVQRGSLFDWFVDAGTLRETVAAVAANEFSTSRMETLLRRPGPTGGDALPLTPQTEGLLNARTLAWLPRGAYLINIARGAHVVESDLIAAVRSGHLAGAALDVQAHEPMPADDPLWAEPGITITPHIAAQSSPRTIAEQFVQGWRCLRRGVPPPNPVDRALGY